MINAISNYLNGLNDSSLIKNIYLVIVAMTNGTLKEAIKNLPNNNFKNNFELGFVLSGLSFLTLMVGYQSFMFSSNFTEEYLFKILFCSVPFLILSLSIIFIMSLMILKIENNNFVGE